MRHDRRSRTIQGQLSSSADGLRGSKPPARRVDTLLARRVPAASAHAGKAPGFLVKFAHTRLRVDQRRRVIQRWIDVGVLSISAGGAPWLAGRQRAASVSRRSEEVQDTGVHAVLAARAAARLDSAAIEAVETELELQLLRAIRELDGERGRAGLVAKAHAG